MCHKTCGCSCESNCSCHRNYMDTICPEGFQGSGCILYNGDILKDLAEVDYIYSNTSLNTVIKQMWVKILEGGSSSDLTQLLTDVNTLKSQMTTVIANIGNLSTLTTTAKGNLVAAINEIDADLTALSDKIGDLNSLTTTNKTTVVAAINEVNAKTTLGTLNNLTGVTAQATNFTDAINDRQPVWKKSTTVTVGASQQAPFNNINTTIDELSKYHIQDNNLIINLEDGTHTINPGYTFNKLPIKNFILSSVSGNKSNCILTASGLTIGNALHYLDIKNITLKSSGISHVINTSGKGLTILNNCIIENNTSSTQSLIASVLGGQIRLQSCKLINKATAAINLVMATNYGFVLSTNLELDNSLGNTDCNLYLSQVNSKIEVIYNNPVNNIVVDRLNSVFVTYLDSHIVVLNYETYTFNNITNFIHCLGLGGSVQFRTQNSSGVNLPTVVNGKGTGFLFISNNSEINLTPITASGFASAFSINNQSKLACTLTISNMTSTCWIDKHSDVNLDGSSISFSLSVPASTAPILFVGTSSRLDFRNGNLIGDAGRRKLSANTNASIYGAGSNLAGAFNVIVTPAILHF